MFLIIANIIWILYACIDGFKDGYYWFFKSSSRRANEFEIHPIFAAQRGIVLLLICFSLLFLVSPISACLNILSNALIFSFFHNGIYYMTRNKLDSKVYPLGWKSQSTTSAAKTTKFFTYRNRTICAVVGIILTALSIILLK